MIGDLQPIKLQEYGENMRIRDRFGCTEIAESSRENVIHHQQSTTVYPPPPRGGGRNYYLL